LRQRHGEDQRRRNEQSADASIEEHRTLDPVERDDGFQDPPAIRKGRKLRVRSLGTRTIGSLDLADGHPKLKCMHADFGFDLEARREHREALDEAPREDSVTGENVAEASSEEAGKKAGEQAISKDVPAAIGVLLVMAAGSDDHVELFAKKHVDHR